MSMNATERAPRASATFRGDGGFAAAGSAGDADDERLGHGRKIYD